MIRGSAEWWARAEEEDPPKDGPSALERIQSELAASPRDEDKNRSCHHIPKPFQGCLNNFVKGPEPIFETMEDMSYTSNQRHHLSIPSGYVGHNQWEQRPLSISSKLHLENPDLIPNVSWDSESNRYNVVPKYREGSRIHRHGPVVDIWGLREDEVLSRPLPNVRHPCSACAGLSHGGQCLYCGQSPNGPIRYVTRGLTFQDCLSCYYIAAGVQCPCCNRYKQRFDDQSLPLERARFWRWLGRNSCCEGCAFERMDGGCPCWRIPDGAPVLCES